MGEMQPAEILADWQRSRDRCRRRCRARRRGHNLIRLRSLIVPASLSLS
jgi:hypothetical protein